MRNRGTKLVFDRDDRYEAASRNIRWICLGLVFVTFPFDSTTGISVYSMVIIVGLYNALRYSPTILNRTICASRANSLAVDHILVLALVIVSGGLSSPYYPLFFILVIAVIASYGIAGFAWSVGAQSVIALTLLLANPALVPFTNASQFIVKLSLLAIFCIVVEQSVRNHDDQYLFANQFSSRSEDEHQRLLSLINGLSNGVLAVDEHGKIYLYNAAALELLNTNRDIVGNSINDLLPLYNAWGDRINLLHLVATEDRAINRQDLTYTASDGSKIILDLTVSPVHVFGYGPSNSGGYMAVFHDITKQKTLEEQRDEFISVTSHELRTPLAIAEANLSTALLPGYAKIPPSAKTLLEQAHNNIIFLGELIQDLTTLAHAERDDLKLKLELVNVSEFAEQLARDYRASAEHKGLRLELVTTGELGSLVTSEHELREVLQNFLTNAIKYTNTGLITLEVERTGQNAVFSVRDTGIGIGASDKSKIFTKFYRSEDYRTRQTGGTGLGLYITSKLAEKLQAKISFSSRLNHGSTFTITVPNAQLEPDPPPPSAKTRV